MISYDIKTCQTEVKKTVEELLQLPSDELSFQVDGVGLTRESLFQKCVEKNCRQLSDENRNRVLSEFEGHGPLDYLLKDKSITEIMINGPNSIWFEKKGLLYESQDHFSTKWTYRLFTQRLCHNAHIHYNLERPMTDGKWNDFRVHILSEELTQTDTAITLRRHPENPWTFSQFLENQYATESQIKILQEILTKKENFLVVGGTGTGKTSLLNACLQFLPQNERAIIIEDTPEIKIPNSVSCKLLTRSPVQGVLPAIDQSELVRQSLRMRPDRLILGEIRGNEAKDLLLALSTGHSGSIGTLHAASAKQALIRLEMLIQLGAPNWSIQAIRNLIFLSIQKIIVLERKKSGHRQINGIYQLSSIESSGILIDELSGTHLC